MDIMNRMGWRALPQRRWARLIAGVCLVGGLAVTWAGAPSGVVNAESGGCANLNDPAHGYDGQNGGNGVVPYLPLDLLRPGTGGSQ